MTDYLELLKKAFSFQEAIPVSDIIPVWFAKELDHAKAMFIINAPFQNNFYEVTFNGKTDEFYIVTYDKDDVTTVKLGDVIEEGE